jgi:hypothetical protein
VLAANTDVGVLPIEPYTDILSAAKENGSNPAHGEA